MKLTKLINTSETVDVYQDGDLAIKVFHDDLPKTLVLYEAFTHARVEELGLPIPKIHEVFRIEGKWAIAMDCIEGKTLQQIIEEDPSNLEGYINDMVDLQLQIHEKQAFTMHKLKDRLIRRIEQLDQIDQIKKYELLTRLDSMPKHHKLCHGNFVPSNIIVSDGKYYVVDWLTAAQGNASADAGRTYLMLALTSDQMAQLYLDTFCKKSGISKKYVQEWLPIVAAAQLAAGNPEETDLLMKWIDVVDYE